MTKNYEIVNIVSGSRLQAINSDKDEIKFVNSATGNVTVVFNATVSGGAKKLTSLLAVNEVVLTPGRRRPSPVPARPSPSPIFLALRSSRIWLIPTVRENG